MISVVAAVRDLARLREITSVLVRHGFGEVVARAGFGKKPATRKGTPSDAPRAGEGPEDAPELHADELARGEEERARISTAERIRLVLQDLGPSFIKLGQIASTRPDLLPVDVIAELKKLQDEVPAVPFADVKRVVEGSLAAPIDRVFASFDERPLATASIGQVHRAVIVTPAGEEQVVVKVQRPNVADTVVRDLELLHVMAAAIERAIPETKLYSPTALVQQFDRSITAELDFTIEAENAAHFAKNFEGTPEGELARFPRVHKSASRKHVLTLEYFDGLKVDRALESGADGKVLARNALRVMIKMTFEDGFFHADPHPGNLIILGRDPATGTFPAPVLGLIDLGMVGRLSPELRDRTVDLMVAAVRKDNVALADALYAIGRPTRKVDMRAFREEVGLLSEKYLGRPLKEIELSALLRDLVQGAVKYGVEIPSDFMMVGKALMTIEGIGKQLDPDLDVFSEAQPHFVRLVRQRYSPQRLGNELIRGVEQLSRAGYDVPLQAREVLEDLRLGRLVVRTVDPTMPAVADRLGRRIFSAVVVASGLVGGAMALPTSGVIAGILFGVAAVVLAVHASRDLLRKSKPDV